MKSRIFTHAEAYPIEWRDRLINVDALDPQCGARMKFIVQGNSYDQLSDAITLICDVCGCIESTLGSISGVSADNIGFVNVPLSRMAECFRRKFPTGDDRTLEFPDPNAGVDVEARMENVFIIRQETAERRIAKTAYLRGQAAASMQVARDHDPYAEMKDHGSLTRTIGSENWLRGHDKRTAEICGENAAERAMRIDGDGRVACDIPYSEFMHEDFIMRAWRNGNKNVKKREIMKC